MRTRYLLLSVLGVLGLVVLGMMGNSGSVLAQVSSPTATARPVLPVPPLPMLVAGSVVGAPDGYEVIARIGDEYQSEAVEVENEEYLLKIAPPHSGYVDREVSFFLEGVEANERILYAEAGRSLQFDLTFPFIPEATLTPTPVPVLPSTYSGNIVIAGGIVVPTYVLVARVGDYQSAPAVILSDLSGDFSGLVVFTSDERLIGEPVEFFLNGVPSTPPAHGVFTPGAKVEGLNLVFTQQPPTPIPATATPTAAPTETPLPTATAVPATATAVPTETAIPTATAVPPTATPVPPTETLPTATAVPPAATAVPPTAPPATTPPVLPTVEPTPEPSGGACSAARSVTAGEAAANVLMMTAPLVMLGGVKYARRRRK